MEIQITQTFKHLLQAETLNADKNKSYYQQYDVKRLRAFHKQEMMKQQIYENMLARRSGMDFSPGMQFQSCLIHTEETKELTMSNKTENKQQKRCHCGSIKHWRVSSKYFPVGLAIIKAKQVALGKGAISIWSKEEERKCLAAEASGKVEISAA